MIEQVKRRHWTAIDCSKSEI